MIAESKPGAIEIEHADFRRVRRKHLMIGSFFLTVLILSILILPYFDLDIFGFILILLLVAIVSTVAFQNLILALTMNRFGVFFDSFAPPVKPLSHRGRYVIAFDDVEAGLLIHQKEHGLLIEVKLAQGKNAVFTTKRLLSFDWDMKDIKKALNGLANTLGDRMRKFAPWELQDKKSYELGKEREINVDVAFAITIVGLGIGWMIAEGVFPGTEPWSLTHRVLLTLIWVAVGLAFIGLLNIRRWLMWRTLLQMAHEVADSQ